MKGDFKNIFNIKDNIKRVIQSKLNQITNKFDTSSYFETDTTYKKRNHKHSYSLYDKLKKINQKNNETENNNINSEKNIIDIGYLTQRDIIPNKKIDLNLPKVFSSRNFIHNKNPSKKLLNSQVKDCYIDSNIINLSPSISKNDIKYKTNGELFLEKLEKEKNIKQKSIKNYTQKNIQTINYSISKKFNSFRRNFDKNKNNKYSSLIRIENNNFSPLSISIKNKNKDDISEIDFSNVLSKIFRIIRIYNQKNEILKEEKVISMIQNEMMEYYKIKRKKEILDDEKKEKIEGFSKDIFNMFKNKEFLLNKIEKENFASNKKENIEIRNKEIYEVFGEAYEKNKLDTYNNLYRSKYYSPKKTYYNR